MIGVDPCEADSRGLDTVKRWAGASACPSGYAASLGNVALPATKVTGCAVGLAGLAVGLGLDLYALDFFETTVRGDGSVSEEFHNVRCVDQERTSCRTRSRDGEA